MLECQPIEKFHHDERLTILLVNLVDCANVGMVQCRCSLRLALKACQSPRIACNLFGQELESDKAVELYILSFVDNPHPAPAEFFDNAVVRDGLPDKLGGCAHWRNGRSNGS